MLFRGPLTMFRRIDFLSLLSAIARSYLATVSVLVLAAGVLFVVMGSVAHWDNATAVHNVIVFEVAGSAVGLLLTFVSRRLIKAIVRASPKLVAYDYGESSAVTQAAVGIAFVLVLSCAALLIVGGRSEIVPSTHKCLLSHAC
jgi:hypothetical protein